MIYASTGGSVAWRSSPRFDLRLQEFNGPMAGARRTILAGSKDGTLAGGPIIGSKYSLDPSSFGVDYHGTLVAGKAGKWIPKQAFYFLVLKQEPTRPLS